MDSSQASRGRREMATWLEVTIVTVALLAAMFLAMWASRREPRVVLRHDASGRSPASTARVNGASNTSS